MQLDDWRFRQIHMDFHTSEHITDVGAKFDPVHFATVLARAHVNSVNCFARCHHGWIYYDTQRFPERRHPHLRRNLLKEQIEACHAHGIKAPIYVTVQWDHYTAMRHPEWVAVTSDGQVESGLGTATGPYDPGFYRALCVNSPYGAFLKELVEDIFATLPVDGFWFDIVKPLDDSSIWTRQEMENLGLEPSDPIQRRAFGQQVIDAFKHNMTSFVRQFSEDCTIFYNEGHIGPAVRTTIDAYTHLEVESLPSGQWGYAHFPYTARYARTLGKPYVGMTGKFHTEWGDFHSFKNRRALEFECFQMLALGAQCSVGDQLHPNGEICQVTYDLIGAVFKQVEEKEDWCRNAKPVTEIAVFTPGEFMSDQTPQAAVGAIRMLQEGGHQFDIVDSSADLSPYKVVIMPDCITTSPHLAAKLEAYISQGGSILASYRSGLGEDGTFAISQFGIKLVGEAPYSPDFIVPEGFLGQHLPRTEHVMYQPGLQIEPLPGTDVLASVAVPYFNRTYHHFCSHQHTPSTGRIGYPGVTKNGSVIYFVHPIFTQYNTNAPRWCKTLVLNALDHLLPEPLLRHNGPSTLITTINEQREFKLRRWIVHLLNYIPLQRSQEVEVIEDVIPLHELALSVKTPQVVASVKQVAPSMILPFEQCDGRVEFVLPRCEGHAMIEINFE